MNNDFRNQIREDLQEYKERFSNIPNIHKDEWGFNFWILDKFYHIEESIISDYIIDYHDLGVDCYVWYEDTKELFLIQNKYYQDSTMLNSSYVADDFLIRPINSLKEGTFKRSAELQKIYTKYSKDKDFTVQLVLYVTNDNVSQQCYEYIRNFNDNHSKENISARLYKLSEIDDKYYGESKENKVRFTYQIKTLNKGTMLQINTKDYHIDTLVDAKYVLTPVYLIYKMYREAKEKQYPLFDANIREYLGNKGINKNIYNTLKDKNDRNNFFYYNNGITIICDKMSVTKQEGDFRCFDIENPQVVNGCQTVNSIYEALDSENPDGLEKEFESSFVMTKILQIENIFEQQELRKSIVTYNNSQNSIDEKTFTANLSEFLRVQSEFEKRGLLLLTKQSDKNTYSNRYSNVSLLLDRCKDLIDKFGLNVSKTSDLMINLDKFLQVILSYTTTSVQAYQKKSQLLKAGSDQYNTVVSFIKNNNVTINAMIDLYLLYLRSEQAKRESNDKKFPVSFFLIDAFGRYECENDPNRIISLLDSKEKVNNLISFYEKVTNAYTSEFLNSHPDLGYNDMVKHEIDYVSLEKYRIVFKSMQ